MQGAWAGEEQAALAHCGSGQAVWLPALRLCHAVPAVPEPTCLPVTQAGASGGALDLAGEVWVHRGPLSLGTTSILMHSGLELPVPSLPGPGKGTSCTDAPFRITVESKEGYPG